MEMGILGKWLLSRSKAITRYSSLGTGIVKFSIEFQGMVTSFILAKSSTPSIIRTAQTRAPGDTVPSTYSKLTQIPPPPGHSDTSRS